MLFSSREFIFYFLPIFMAVYLLIPRKFRNVALLAGSAVFCVVGEWMHLWHLALLTWQLVANFAFYRLQGSRPCDSSARKRGLAGAVILDVIVLFVFKYTAFAASTIDFFAGTGFASTMDIALPLGISFYTFQMISFQIDVYRGKITEDVSLLEYVDYILMFPKFISGPVAQYGEVGDALKDRTVDGARIESGLKDFTIGLAMKVLVANKIGTLWSAIRMGGAGSLPAVTAWLGAAAYSFQIYFDFWGYSLMAIGLGSLLGFTIPVNFRDPYASRSISEFWRRWHITLGRWFKEYLYFPLGGSRRGFAATVRNLFVVWALTGLWHGASWNFVLWGLVFFAFIMIEKTGIGRRLESSRVIGHVLVICIIPVTWVIFGISDFGELWQYLLNMVGIQTVIVGDLIPQFERYITDYWWLLLICLALVTPYPGRIYRKFKNAVWMLPIYIALFWYCIYQIETSVENPFLYFRF